MSKFPFPRSTFYIKTTELFIPVVRRNTTFQKRWVLREFSDAANSFSLHCLGHPKRPVSLISPLRVNV